MQRLYLTVINFLQKLKVLHLVRAIHNNLSLLFFIRYWKIKRKTPSYDIHCYGKLTMNVDHETWSDILSRYINKPCNNYCYHNVTNEGIIESVVTQCSGVQKPKAIFILFEDIDIVEYFTADNTTERALYEQFQYNTIEDNSPLINYKIIYSDINLVYNFIHHLEYINLFCDINGIRLYWYIPSAYMRRVNIKKYHEHVVGNTLYEANMIKNIPAHNFNDNLAKEFANLFLNSK